MALPDLSSLGFLNERRAMAVPKGKTRLEQTVEDRPLVKVDENKFRAEVWARDKNRCRCCRRKVQKVLGRVPERGEVHHIHGRSGDLRFEDKAALLLCLGCHERVTGRVNDKLIIVASQFFCVKGNIGQSRPYTDARFPVTFKRVA